MMKLADETVVEDLSAVEGANLYTHTHGRVGASHFEEPQNEGCQGWERRKVTCIRDGTDATVGTEYGPGPVCHAMG